MPSSITSSFSCRAQCAACCIAPSISTPMPKMPHGKPAGVRCAHLLNDLRCELFGLATRPRVCSSLQASMEMCGSNRDYALQYLHDLERLSNPSTQSP